MEERVTETIQIDATPDKCFAVVSDVEKYPLWTGDLREVRVESKDSQGRPSEVLFRAAAFGRSTSYKLRYDYSEAPGKLSWVQIWGDLTSKLDGYYKFEPKGKSTIVTYVLEVDLKFPLPGFIKRRAQSRIMNAALKELKNRVETVESVSK